MSACAASAESKDSGNASFQEIGDAIRGADCICVLSHFRPDGDAIGSEVGLGLSLLALGKEVYILNDDGCPERFRFLPGTERVITPSGRAARGGPDNFL